MLPTRIGNVDFNLCLIHITSIDTDLIFRETLKKDRTLPLAVRCEGIINAGIKCPSLKLATN